MHKSVQQNDGKRNVSKSQDRETKLRPNSGAEETRLSLQGAVRDEAISVCGQRLLRSARNDTLTLCYAVGVLSHSPYLYFPLSSLPFTLYVLGSQELTRETL